MSNLYHAALHYEGTLFMHHRERVRTNNTTHVDCSELIRRAMVDMGYRLPYERLHARELFYHVGEPVEIPELQQGDLGFTSHRGGYPTHVFIVAEPAEYLDHMRIFHASTITKNASHSFYHDIKRFSPDIIPPKTDSRKQRFTHNPIGFIRLPPPGKFDFPRTECRCYPRTTEGIF